MPAGSHWALFVGRIEPQKGLNVLLDAARDVARHRADWHLAIVGAGPDASRLRAQAERDPVLANRVHWLGRREDVPGLLKGADLLVLPSLWEGMPNVVLEAMAARRAVVATRVEGSEELIEHGRTGWLVPPGDSPALVQALLDAHSDVDRLARMGEAGRARVEANHTPECIVAAYERHWAGILGLAIDEFKVEGPTGRS
jgi:starch synthase (maltosyl-transferring)